MKIYALEKKYKEVMDAMQQSGEGIDSVVNLDKDIPGFRRFAEIHSVM